MKDGDRLLQELAQKRYEAEKLHRLAIFKAMMANENRCDRCGADKKAYREMLGEDCCNQEREE